MRTLVLICAFSTAAFANTELLANKVSSEFLSTYLLKRPPACRAPL